MPQKLDTEPLGGKGPHVDFFTKTGPFANRKKTLKSLPALGACWQDPKKSYLPLIDACDSDPKKSYLPLHRCS
jgi:hypothetical protein